VVGAVVGLAVGTCVGVAVVGLPLGTRVGVKVGGLGVEAHTACVGVAVVGTLVGIRVGIRVGGLPWGGLVVGGTRIKRRGRVVASTGVAIQGSSSTATEPGRSIATELLVESTTPTSAISRDVRQTLHQGLFSVPAESALFDGQATPKSTRSAETSCPAMLFTLCTCNGRRLCKETAQVSKRCRRLAWVLYVTQGCDAYTIW
jgi:hypothetical protein